MPIRNTISMQQIITDLQMYWAAYGCAIGYPYSEKVGAGTMNPATFLRVLGPEPWKVAYVEPSFRPADGRYAENPNRMQMHTQYQVILKPDPGNPQELYLGSLQAIGLELSRHDVRFVEDNWESPALGAWGLGWEVWLDGQEITQFTYFQQAGSLPLNPVSVEITYGLDRIVMYLQNKRQVWDIDVDGIHTFAEIYRIPEIEHCVYNFELADVDRLKQMFELYHGEAEACIRRGLVIPAYDYVLRQSQTFNLLDARGTIGVTERAKFFATIRAQARATAELYIAQREYEKYPWLQDSYSESKLPANQTFATPTPVTVPTSQSFLLEIGSEELPPSDVVNGIEQIQINLAKLLQEQRLFYTDLRVTGTPRRLAAYVTELGSTQADQVVEKRGPTVISAFDADGRPTKAAEGFARSQHVDVSQLEVRGDYTYAVKRIAGRLTAEILPSVCTALLDSLRWSKTMRWNSSNITYPRPLRWIVALYGNQVVPFTWANVTSGRSSRGPRFADAAFKLPQGVFTTFDIKEAANYFDAIQITGVLVDRSARRHHIAELIEQVAATVHGVVRDVSDLLDEVTDLVEAPQALLGSFDAKYLELPEPVLISVMRKHQRYFPIFRNDKLLPNFITVANATDLTHPDVVMAGNERVIRARYADAAFFYRQDQSRPLESYRSQLNTLTFHEKLGSMLDKVKRLEKLAPQIAHMLNADDKEINVITRAATLSKSDLVTAVVVEMTSLQGIMGEIYALNSGELPAVAQAICEHYLPRSSGDANPMSLPGLILSLADKLDTLVGLFSVGAMPTGKTDPFGLRRTALGLVQNLLNSGREFSLLAGLQKAVAVQSLPVEERIVKEIHEFLAKRLQRILLELGYDLDVVEAVLTVQVDNPVAAKAAVQMLSHWREQPESLTPLTAYSRCARLVRNIKECFVMQPENLVDPLAETLYTTFVSAKSQIKVNPSVDTVMAVLTRLSEPINRFLDSTLVLHDDDTVRMARISLLQHIVELPEGIVDLTRLVEF